MKMENIPASILGPSLKSTTAQNDGANTILCANELLKCWKFRSNWKLCNLNLSRARSLSLSLDLFIWNIVCVNENIWTTRVELI